MWIRCQTACKPGSVRITCGDAGRPFLWDACRHAPHATNPGGKAETPPRHGFRRTPAAPIRSCSRWGLPCQRRCRRRGALLPHRFTLTRGPIRREAGWPEGGLFSVALSLGSPPPVVIRHRVPVEPGLSSNAWASREAFTSAAARPSGPAHVPVRARRRKRPRRFCATQGRWPGAVASQKPNACSARGRASWCGDVGQLEVSLAHPARHFSVGVDGPRPALGRARALFAAPQPSTRVGP